MEVYPHHPIYHIPLPKSKKEFFAMQKSLWVLKVLMNRVVFRFFNDRVLFRFLSDKVLLTVFVEITWFHFLFSCGRSTCYSDTLHDFSVTIPRCCKHVYVNSFFPGTAKLWNSLPIECFPLTYDLSGFKSRINRYLLTVVSL